jgi:hypothetical protein
MKRLIIIIITLFVASCTREAQKEVSTTNANFKVKLLFEIDGCKVYRFVDNGDYKYFTTCNGSVSWNTTTQNGKTTTIKEHTIETK